MRTDRNVAMKDEDLARIFLVAPEGVSELIPSDYEGVLTTNVAVDLPLFDEPDDRVDGVDQVIEEFGPDFSVLPYLSPWETLTYPVDGRFVPVVAHGIDGYSERLA